ncbi:MAG: TolC family protein, partial [Bacteroidota bacterium]
KSAKEQQTLLKQLVENGVYRQSDYLTLLLEIQLQESDLNDLQIQYRKELSALKLLCGVRDTSNSNLEQPHIVLNAASIKDSPFLHKFKIDSLQIINEKQIIDRSYKPVISWMSDAGLINNDPSLLYKNLGVSVGISLTVPIYDGNQRVLNYRKLQYTEETRKNYEGYFKQQFDQQIAQLNEELSGTLAVIPKLKQQLSLGESIVKEQRLLLNNGGVTLTELINAVKNLQTLKRGLNQYELKVMSIMNEINYWRE